MLCRRMFLKSSALFAATFLGAKSALAKLTDADHLANQLSEDKLKLPEGKLSLYNINNRERLTVTYRNSLGEYCQDALHSLNWILRCHNTNETTEMDLRVLEYLNRVVNCFGGDHEVHIISGYRSPAYNRMLRSHSHGVAKDSYHMKGRAIDFCIPGVALDKLRKTALALAAGGVGYYPHNGWVHIDSGHFRTWG
ncbi:MAG TPA: DUF882 domain-containing protein [Geomonas sp.]|nr:DUF882 domain-containing protein [Geomonas sp.]